MKLGVVYLLVQHIVETCHRTSSAVTWEAGSERRVTSLVVFAVLGTPSVPLVSLLVSKCSYYRKYVQYGMVWYGMVWYGMVWYGMEKVARSCFWLKFVNQKSPSKQNANSFYLQEKGNQGEGYDYNRLQITSTYACFCHLLTRITRITRITYIVYPGSNSHL